MVKLATYNIQYSKGKDGRFELDRIADAVRDADVICLQEVVRNVPGIPDPDQPARLGELLPQHHWVYGPAVDLDASTVGPDGTVDNKRRQFGNMVLSRWPILSSRLLLLPRVRTYESTAGQRGALEAIIDAPVKVFAFPNGRPGRDYTAEHVAMVREALSDPAMVLT